MEKQPMTGNGWNEWRNLVLAELERLSEAVHDSTNQNVQEHKEIREDIGTTKTEIAMLKVKASFWGAMAGAVPTALAILWYIMTQG